MKQIEYITIDELCNHYEIETSFILNLNEYGLLHIKTVESVQCIYKEDIRSLEKIIRLQQDLNLNLEGIDTVFNLLDKIEALKKELNKTKNRLRIFEE